MTGTLSISKIFLIFSPGNNASESLSNLTAEVDHEIRCRRSTEIPAACHAEAERRPANTSRSVRLRRRNPHALRMPAPKRSAFFTQEATSLRLALKQNFGVSSRHEIEKDSQIRFRIKNRAHESPKNSPNLISTSRMGFRISTKKKRPRDALRGTNGLKRFVVQAADLAVVTWLFSKSKMDGLMTCQPPPAQALRLAKGIAVAHGFALARWVTLRWPGNSFFMAISV